MGGVCMDRSLIEEHLAQANRHVAEGEGHVTKRRELVAQLERDGHDTTEALKLLGHLRSCRNCILQIEIGLRKNSDAILIPDAALPRHIQNSVSMLAYEWRPQTLSAAVPSSSDAVVMTLQYSPSRLASDIA